jgi:hypothetical protein
MKTTPIDPVMAEMHAIKDANSARFGHDPDRLFRHLQKQAGEPRRDAPARSGKAKPPAAPARPRVRPERKKVNA